MVTDKETGAPVVLPIDASYVEFREAVDAQPGRYRLDPLDERRKVVPSVAAAYLTLNDAPRNSNAAADGESGEVSMMREMMRWNTELSRMQLDLARGIAERFSGVMQAAAELIRAADGAGIAARQPVVLPAPENVANDEIEEDEDPADDEAPPLHPAVEIAVEALPLVKLWLEAKQAEAAARAAQAPASTVSAAPRQSTPREAPAPMGSPTRAKAPATEEPAPTNDADPKPEPPKPAAEAASSAAAEEAAPENVAPTRRNGAGSLVRPTAAQIPHLMAVHARLTADERAVAAATAVQLSEDDQRALLDELCGRSVAEAASLIRSLMGDQAKATEGES
ncbi:MAG: hypothetical protein KC464_16135 [Myxococcales bacterium]|nr:hypothetical protein [Myxococcales bacterium]